ncbi:MAG: ribonuclease domain-containing protein [Clostridiaceae bacterium]
MRRKFNKITSLLLILILSIVFSGCAILELEENSVNTETGINVESPAKEVETSVETGASIKEDGYYTSKDEVALYLHTFGKLPDNFITKNEAMDKGWKSSEGNLWDVTDKMSIGGDRFGNREGRLPEANGRKWFECDIDYKGGYRGEKRIVYSSDGLIYYTDDHYSTFKKLY